MIKLLTVFALIAPSLTMAQSLKISDAYAFQANPASKNGAVFMRIDNPSDKAIIILDARSNAASRVEIHTNTMDGDLMKMVHLEDGLEVPAEGCALLERGGFHVMLMGLKSNLIQDETIKVALTTRDGEELEFEVPVDMEHEASETDDLCVRAETAKMMHGDEDRIDSEHESEMGDDDMDHD